MKSYTYKYKGTKLVPLTPATAISLDSRDYLKYIGPDDRRWNTIHGVFNRRPFMLPNRPTVKGNILVISFPYSSTFNVPLEHLALVRRGDPNALKFSYAKRFIPSNLKRFKADIGVTIKRTKKNIDAYLDELPLHKRLEFFKEMSPEDKKIYDCLYKDIEVLIGLKEESEDPTNVT